jgi:hypothetical protein
MDQDERHREELMILEALVQAMDRRDEVFQVIEDSENVDEAIHSPEASVRLALLVQKNSGRC